MFEQLTFDLAASENTEVLEACEHVGTTIIGVVDPEDGLKVKEYGESETLTEDEIRADFDTALASVEHGEELSATLHWGFDETDIANLEQLYIEGKHRDKIIELLEDCNFHTEVKTLLDTDPLEIIEDGDDDGNASPNRIYHPINEQLAEHAHYMNSMHDYVKNSQTDEYRHYCDICYNLAEKCAKERPKCAEKAWYKAQKYAYKLAQWFNNNLKNEASCPSVLVSGPANFPVKKKERQNSRRDSLHREWNEIAQLPEQIKRMIYGTEVIKSDEADAVEQLKDKIERLEKDQERMKFVNAYYRKHKTVKGCEGISDDLAEQIMAAIQSDWRGKHAMPYNSYLLTNNNQNIHRLKDRLKDLEATKEAGTSEEETDLFKVVRNSEAMRLQLLFDGKPDEETRSILKRHGFKYAPSQSAWQRNLNANGEYALRMVKKDLGIE